MLATSRFVLAPLIVAACSQSAAPSESAEPAATKSYGPTHATRVEYEAIRATPMTVRGIGLCELVDGYDAGAGLYRVGKIIGVSEPSGPATYIELELLEAWSANAPGNPIARVPGGPSADGKTTALSSIDARQGEEIGALLAPPTPENNDFYGLFPAGVFHEVNGGYTNGQLFRRSPVATDVLKARIDAAVSNRGRASCPDHQPDPVTPSVEAPQGDIQIVGPEIKGVDGRI